MVASADEAARARRSVGGVAMADTNRSYEEAKAEYEKGYDDLLARYSEDAEATAEILRARGSFEAIWEMFGDDGEEDQ